MQITKLEEGTSAPKSDITVFTKEELQQEFDFILAEKIVRKMAKKGLILCKNIGNVFVGDNLVIHFCNRLCRNIGKKQKRFPINFTDNRIVTVRIRVVKSFWDSSHLFLNSSVIKFIDGSVV